MSTQPDDRAYRLVRKIRVMPEGLPGMDVREVDFNEWDRYAGQSVAQGYARMRESGWIDDDEPDAFVPSRLYAIDEYAFVIALHGGQLDACSLRLLGQSPVDVSQSLPAIDSRLPGPKQIQVGAVQEEDLPP